MPPRSWIPSTSKTLPAQTAAPNDPSDGDRHGLASRRFAVQTGGSSRVKDALFCRGQGVAGLTRDMGIPGARTTAMTRCRLVAGRFRLPALHGSEVWTEFEPSF